MTNATIMIIEDESIIARDIECILKNNNFNIAGPYSRAEDAIDVLDKIHPDLILMDVVLKGDIDGIDAAEIIRKKISIPIIYLAAYADDTTLNRIKGTGLNGYFLKPFEEKELCSWIDATILKSRKEQELHQNQNWLIALINSIDNAVIATDENGYIKTINTKAEMLTGYSNDKMYGEKIIDYLKIQGNNKNYTFGTLRSVAEKAENRYSFYLKRSDNKRISVSYNVSPVIQNGNTNGYLSTITEKNGKNNVTETIKELSKELNKAKDELKQLAYVASHDLQEPLRMIASYVQLIQKRYKGKIDTDADEFISFAVEGVNRMKALLNDLLVYSRLNTVSVVFTTVDVNAVVQQAIKSINKDFLHKKFEIKYDSLPIINADSSQIKQMFYNILSNAVKFNNKDVAKVNISYNYSNNYHEFKISDNGIGMESEYYSRIFGVFQRLHNYNEYPGTGIGLATCKKIAENHNGRIRVESVTGKGSSFFIKISN